jgi:hypothetical protein
MTFFSSLVMGRLSAAMPVAVDGDAIIFSPSLPRWPFSRGAYGLKLCQYHTSTVLGRLRKCNLDKS